ncbi:MAG: 30S ribosomal protein S27ae [Candidatus Heimdallarchaeaceae archaeon]|uniref:Small ribosomal subunit protein eS31 n=1 Tax=Candidatus Heimdallarchaeum endolithica TaxID=2876572 RepID=A0A9Y1FMG4_9ARCH|nr:MAG: 30S ribosomal protein S27ae [Candidatus Heimdallarchaeum endolithica]
MTQAHKYYKIEGDKIVRVKKVCERCGGATYMAEHKDRWTCGKCGFTQYKRGRKFS